ncbi:MAG: hypothetical protein NDI82_00095 [Anaeromyxobacteraceae bacterium]|nr:hypothetical protein [Anaeromyxobacteraceae bacterium]
MDLQTRLAIYRTLLAEQRTALSHLQLGLLLVTLPVSLHAALMLVAERHQTAGRLDVLGPMTALLGMLVVAGLYLSARAVRSWARAVRNVRRPAELDEQ